MPTQITVRATEDLVARIKSAAADTGRSMNDWVVVVLDAATNPELAGSEMERFRERLARAGLLAPPSPPIDDPPNPAAVEAAGRRAAHGKLLSDLVIEGR